jgi:hypothetical protein
MGTMEDIFNSMQVLLHACKGAFGTAVVAVVSASAVAVLVKQIL